MHRVQIVDILQDYKPLLKKKVSILRPFLSTMFWNLASRDELETLPRWGNTAIASGIENCRNIAATPEIRKG